MKQKKDGRVTQGVLSLLITFAILGAVYLLGPVSAITLDITTGDSTVIVDQQTNFTVSVDIDAGEVVPIQAFNLSVGEESCTFTLADVSCDIAGISIAQANDGGSYTNVAGYASGYGKTYGYSGGYAYDSYYMGSTGYGYSEAVFGATEFSFAINWTPTVAGEYPIHFSVQTGSPNSITFYDTASAVYTVNATTVATATNTTVTESITQVVFDSGSTGVEQVVVPINNTGNVSLNMSALLSGGNVSTSPTKNLTLVRAYNNSGTAVNYSVKIPASTTISGGATWNGTLKLPTVKVTSDYSVSSGTLDTVIEVGEVGAQLNFSSPVQLILENVPSGSQAAFSSSGSSLTTISTVCDATENPTNINSVSPRECYVMVGTTMYINTYHFTTFGAFTPTSTTTESTSSATHNGGGSSDLYAYYYNTTSTPSTALEILDAIRGYYSGSSRYSALELLDIIRAYYEG